MSLQIQRLHCKGFPVFTFSEEHYRDYGVDFKACRVPGEVELEGADQYSSSSLSLHNNVPFDPHSEYVIL